MLTSVGLDAHAASGQGFVVAPPRLGAGGGVIIISHTATTTFARQAREEALDAGARVVSITGEGKGWPEAIEATNRPSINGINSRPDTVAETPSTSWRYRGR